ncbi:Centromere/kinetochore protein zw10 like [Verticillium longisporum]|uniref:Centromere/kinetochore protein zw10 like n=1 Tax=Verticillium longisporum TaxID=100787 RepID=A0A8I2ZMB6_VERLO|nr:Centromere/kinetochore protein zw10 like [Verticillium longisporum]
MAVGTDTRTATQLGDAIVAFALQGEFPDEGVSSLSLAEGDLSPAIEALARAKGQLESEIHTINEETKGDVSSWVRNAKTLQEDILRSKRLADDIVRQSEAPDVSGKTIQDAVDHVEFLRREVLYSQQLHEALTGIRYVNDLLAEVEQAMNERRILDALRLLEKSWTELDNVPVNKKSCRVMRLLDVRAFELKSAVHKVFDHVWNTLVHVDSETKRLSIYSQRETEQMTLSEAVIGLEAYKEVDDRMSQLWQDIDRAIVSPRMDVRAPQLLAIQASENVLEARGEAGRTIDDLFADLQKVVEFLAKRLPPDLLIYLSPIMMSDVVPRLVSTWLDAAVPSSLRDIGQFQAVIKSASAFCSALEQNGFSGFTELKEWVGNAPSIWLAKCRETALDAVRNRISEGLGETRQVEKVEKQMVSRSEGKELAANGVAAQADDDDWGAAWGEEDAGQPEPEHESHGSLEQSEAKHDAPPEDDGADAWGWDDDDQTAGAKGDSEEPKKGQEDDDDAAAAWGWGDDDGDAAAASTSVPAPAPAPARTPAAAKRAKSTSTAEESREMVLKETYHISSMPDPVLELILAILEDGATLTQASNENNPVVAAAPGLFSLPTLALAMFRAVSPHYYAMELGGNMLLYNDAMYLAERLSEVGERWKARDDVTPRARNMLRIDNDVKGLQGFANRAYTGELSTQKTVLGDLVGGEQSLMQQDEMDSCIDSAMARVRSMAVTWESILARSVWYQAVGALVDRLATKIISDVMDMASVGQDEAYKIAQLIAKVTELDDLFLPSRPSSSAATAGGREQTAPDAEEIPATAQYASSWLRLKYLSEVLQSNLNEVKYLWCDSELSLYFSADEVVDLIEASFEANARTKETIREIRERPQPVLT